MRSLPAALFGILLFCASAAPVGAESAGLRIRFGLTDDAPSEWHGRITVDPGRVAEVRGWRFAGNDRVIGADSWRAWTVRANDRRRSNRSGVQRARNEPPLENGVVVRLEDVTGDSEVRIETPRGELHFHLRDLPYGAVETKLGGAVDIQRTAATRHLTETPTEDDFPSAALDSAGRTHVAWVRFSRLHPDWPRIIELGSPPGDFASFAEPSRGDQVLLATLTPDGMSKSVAITPPGRDVYKCAVAVDGKGRVWVFWSERQDGRFDVWGRSVTDGVAGDPVRLSPGEGNDHSVVATTDAAGRIWLAWQGAREGVFQILSRHQAGDGSWTPEERVSPQEHTSWAPAIAATRPGAEGTARVAIVWDTYEKGDYDVWLREYDLDGRERDAAAAANSAKYQARSSADYDLSGNLWIAWEWSGATWGKDRGAAIQNEGIGLLVNRKIGLIIRAPDGNWLEPAQPVSAVMPQQYTREIPKRDPGSMSEAARAALPYLGRAYHNLSRVVVDASGRPWLLFRSRAVEFQPTVGSMWLEYAAYYENGSWTGPILIPNSDNLLYSVPAVTAPPGGGLTLVYASDHRQSRRARPALYPGELDVTKAYSDPWVNDLFIGRIDASGVPSPPVLGPAATPPNPKAAPTEATRAERGWTKRGRSARTTVRGKPLRLVRGEFHRHTELSSDGGADGPLEDMWRYALDVAALDWVGNGDHDNGHGREYAWWMIQKTTDAYAIPGRFTTLFSYERSRPFPEGHRNVVFPKRGIRPLPRLALAKESDPGPAPDTEMLYQYLEEHGGISAPHTTGTTMGTDWRNHHRTLEPLVEIYQGSRNSYEMPGAPRTATGRLLRSGRPEGFVSNALAKGQRLGFIASSDHHSTHISYAMVWAEEPTRESIFDALRTRRAYAATDDIVADVRIGSGEDERFMGEELTTSEAAKLTIHLEGTASFSKVVVVKDGRAVKTFEPGEASVQLTWTDPEPAPGETSHYYVRGEQEDGELVWTSPIFVSYEEAT